MGLDSGLGTSLGRVCGSLGRVCGFPKLYIPFYSRGMLIGFVLAAALALASATVLFCHPATSLRPYVHATHGFVSAARLL